MPPSSPVEAAEAVLHLVRPEARFGCLVAIEAGRTLRGTGASREGYAAFRAFRAAKDGPARPHPTPEQESAEKACALAALSGVAPERAVHAIREARHAMGVSSPWHWEKGASPADGAGWLAAQ